MSALYPLSIVAILAWNTVAFGACVPTKQRSCVDLSVIPDIAEQVIAPVKLGHPADKEPPAPPSKDYTGPTIGVSNAVRRAPEIGYRWSIN